MTGRTGSINLRGRVALSGWGNAWLASVVHESLHKARPVWTESDFELPSSVTPGRHPVLKLKRPLRLRPDLSRVPVGGEFTLETAAVVTVLNRRGRESRVVAHLREPPDGGGIAVHKFGLDATNRPRPRPIPGAAPVPACEPGSNPGAGALAFSAPRFVLPEFTAVAPQIFV